jgi:hypothetical protein
VPKNPAVRGPRRRHYALEAVTLVWRPRRCHAAGAHSPAGEPPFLIGRRLRPTSPPLRAHAGVPVGQDGEVEPPLCAYKTSPSFSLARAREHTVRRRPPLAPPTTLLLRLLPC